MQIQKKISGDNAMRIAAFCLFTILYVLPISANAQAADFLLNNGGGEYRFKTGKTFLDARYHEVIRQKFDFSCGSAALATLLSYHYGYPVKEKTVLESMYAVGDQAKIRREGFSLLDMKRYLASIGYKANGFRESLDKLVSVGIPAITLINHNGYLHFVVVKGVTEDKVLVADPTAGNKVIDRKQFESMWNGVLFVLMNDMDYARAHFNNRNNWKSRGAGRFDTALLNDELSSFTVHVSVTPGYY